MGELAAVMAALIGLLAVAGGCGGGETDGDEETLSPAANRAVLAAFEHDIGRIMVREAERRARRSAVSSMAGRDELEGADIHHAPALERLYASRDDRPVWHEESEGAVRATDAARELERRLVEAVRSHGLWPEQVHLSALREIDGTTASCCARWSELSLTDAQRRALLEYLAEQKMDLTVAEDLDTVAKLAADPEGPTPELAEAVDQRAAELVDDHRRTARRDVLLSDALAEYLVAMRYGNPVWHQPRSWRATFRDGDRGPVRSSTYAGEQKETTAASEMRQAIQRARTRTLLVETLGDVFDQPGSVGSAMAETLPPFRGYRRLVEAFRRYRPIVERGGWPEVPSSARELKIGDVSRDVRTLKERLRIEGYWSPPTREPDRITTSRTAGSSPTAAATASAAVVERQARARALAEIPRSVDEYEMVFDRRLKEAVLAYQRSHQLWDHGSVTPETLRSLNVPARRRWNQIRVSLQRWRESNIGADDHYVRVNIADFHAEVWRDGERKMRFKVITGRAKRTEDSETGTVRYPLATPSFSDTIEYIVLNPYWNVPPSIRKNELQPKLEENPDYYEEEGFEVVVDDSGREYVRQKPGPNNALGKVKFLFPNEHSVYLHDTPAKHLFDKPVRAFSHGCVRIAKPMEFAHYLLDLDGRWTGEDRKRRLEQWFAKEGETWLALRQSVPIHIEYEVVRVDADGHANFLADVYDRDAPRVASVDERLNGYPDAYDLPAPEMTELWQTALAGELDPRRDLAPSHHGN